MKGPSQQGLRRGFFAAIICSYALISCGASATKGASTAADASTSEALPATDDRTSSSIIEETLLAQADAWHLLSRASFGPSPQSLKVLSKTPFLAWLESQLHPPADEKDKRLTGALRAYMGSQLAPFALIGHYQQSGPEDAPSPKNSKWKKKKDTVNYRKLLQEMQMTELTRHMLSRYQLREVMVDFWANHLNIFARKGDIKLIAGSWMREVIRPHALGRFENLLSASAQHAAMLIYLDNESSVKEQRTKKGHRGPNENYARELLELHTLGVNGGYDQQDVKETARVFTGWSVQRRPQGYLEFAFHKKQHDRGTKVVLSRAYKQGGMKEGLALLSALAKHPQTARHLASKLCQRFVSDVPPPACIEAAQASYLSSKGDTTKVLKTIFTHPSFWDDKNRGQKVKTPIEYVISAARALDAEPDGGLELVGHLRQMGQEPLMQRIPTGYPEKASAWNSSAGMLSRFRFAALFSAQWSSGAVFDWNSELRKPADAPSLTCAMSTFLLGRKASPETLSVISESISMYSSRVLQRRLALSLFLSSPEFQRQ